MNKTLKANLERFKAEKISNIGGLGAVLVISRQAQKMTFPLDPDKLITEGGGQVAGLSGAAINRILGEHGEVRRVGTESGRTSRGTVGLARSYARFLNDLRDEERAELRNIERWWVSRFSEYFDTEPFKLTFDQSKTLRSALEDLLNQAVERQKRYPGKTYVGTVLQHLVGAKLELALPSVKVVHHGSSVADAASARFGDFAFDDVVIHCTTAPQDSLLQKCKANLGSGKRPIILTIAKMIGAAESLADSAGISDRVEIIDALQFVTMNLYELSLFKASARQMTIDKLVRKFNEIITNHESDQSLRIKLE